MNLQQYHSMRHPGKTPEPWGGKRHAGKKVFVVQEHHASHLHYDFRLEWDGVLKSWAVPKGPSPDPRTKRLAIEVEDHPLDYAGFEGTIPRGEYGAGEVRIWDRGEWIPPKGGFDESYRRGRIEFQLKGRKLKGTWALVRAHFAGEERQHQWLLMKRGAASDARLPAVTLPDFIPPALATLVKAPPEGAQWLHEVKFDGYRTICRIDHGQARMLTRKGLDWTHRYPALAEEAGSLPIRNAVLDGEIVFLKPNGASSFEGLQGALKAGKTENLYFYVFDLLFLDGEDWRGRPLEARKKKLAEIIASAPSRRIRLSDHWSGAGAPFLEKCCESGLEGVVSKDARASYSSGRSTHWLKAKCRKGQELVIGGYTDPGGTRAGFGALLLGYYEKGGLRFAGKVGTGFNDRSLSDLYARLHKLTRTKSPFSAGSPRERGIHWVEPSLTAEVTFSNWTTDGLLRQAVFHGLREDKPPREVIREEPKKTPSANPSAAVLADVPLSHPDKILYPGPGITKLELAQYYSAAAPQMLPHIERRPLTLVRCPSGAGKKCFYQRHPRETSPFVHSGATSSTGEPYAYIEDASGLVSLAQLGVLEIHGWGSRHPDAEKPDIVVFDLDPGPGVQWKDMVESAFALKDLLERLDLKSYVNVTGGKGLHVRIPLAPVYGWKEVKAFAKTIATELAARMPRLCVLSPLKAKRRGKIFVDYLRNDLTATSIALFSTRARDGAPVALPITWAHLKKGVAPDEFKLRDVFRLLDRWKDPWPGYFRLKQRITLLDRAKR